MKGSTIALSLGLVVAGAFGIWQYAKRQDDQKEYLARLLSMQAVPPVDEEGVFRPPVQPAAATPPVTGLFGAYGVTRL